MEINFIKEILMSTAEYWVVAKKVISRQYFESVREDDHIMLISIPNAIERGIKYEDIKLKQVEEVSSLYIWQNIYLNCDYPPFQQYITFHDVYKGYPIEFKVKEFLIKSLELQSNDIYSYSQLIESEPIK